MTFTIVGRSVGPIGFGMNGLTHAPKNVPTADAIAVLKAALERGANFWNAGEIYGTLEYNSLHLLHAYFTQYPEDADRVVVSVKACFDMWTGRFAMCDAASVRASIEHCLAILAGTCRIDVFQAARLDPELPVEETVGAIAEFVAAGKIGGVGLSECSAASIRRAAVVTPVAAVEVELSLFETGIFNNGVAEACAESGIPIVAYSPLNKGFLSGQLRKYDDLPEKDYRRMFPRFQPEAFDENLKLVSELEEMAKKKGCSTNQIALAWVCAQSDAVRAPVIPIPGTTKVERVEENTERIELSSEEIENIAAILAKIEVKGGRAPPQFARFLEI